MTFDIVTIVTIGTLLLVQTHLNYGNHDNRGLVRVLPCFKKHSDWLKKQTMWLSRTCWSEMIFYLIISYHITTLILCTVY